jgi:hypothetical protein
VTHPSTTHVLVLSNETECQRRISPSKSKRASISTRFFSGWSAGAAGVWLFFLVFSSCCFAASRNRQSRVLLLGSTGLLRPSPFNHDKKDSASTTSDSLAHPPGKHVGPTLFDTTKDIDITVSLRLLSRV